MNATYYVKIDDGSHDPYAIYRGPNKTLARKALVFAERVFYAMVETGAVSHNLEGQHTRLEWEGGCPPAGSTFQVRKRATA